MKKVKIPNKMSNLLLGESQDKLCIFQRKVYSKNVNKENKKSWEIDRDQSQRNENERIIEYIWIFNLAEPRRSKGCF